VKNNTLHFESKDVLLRVEQTETLYTADYTKGQILRVPIAHGEGNYEADEATLQMLEATGRVVFRYVNAAGEVTDDANPNGSQQNIAGIMNEAGNVMGMMPHPERAMEPILGSTDGIGVFTSLVKALTPAGT
jgi:phosphoribosylformylglycinamidine synthase I